MATKHGADDSAVTWEWEGGGSWKGYASEDKDLLEGLWTAASGSGKITTKGLTFSKGKTKYDLDFDAMTQTNKDTSKVRKIKRTGPPPAKKAFKKSKSGDFGFAEGLSTCKVSAWKGDSTIPDPPPLDAAAIKAQAALGPQSKRGMKKIDYGPAVTKNAHAKHCFDKMLSNEHRNVGEWAVFYHSYSTAALIYEVQAAIASVLFRFKAMYGSLPRLMRGCFSDIPDAPAMMKEFPSWKDQDHNPRFKSVGICVTTNLIATDPEAPPRDYFLSGYVVGALSVDIITGMFTDCGVDAAAAKKLSKDILALAGTHGLDVSAFGGTAAKSGFSGHLLQIFMKRHLVDKYIYAALPMGVPDKKRHPLGAFLQSGGKVINGQGRCVVHPSAFMQANKVRIFVYSADPDYHKNRGDFQKAMAGLLDPILGSKEARTKAALGIFGGSLPKWFKPDDQREVAEASDKKLEDWK